MPRVLALFEAWLLILCVGIFSARVEWQRGNKNMFPLPSPTPRKLRRKRRVPFLLSHVHPAFAVIPWTLTMLNYIRCSAAVPQEYRGKLQGKSSTIFFLFPLEMDNVFS